jgi:lipid-binding SYLF domain-containing protein
MKARRTIGVVAMAVLALTAPSLAQDEAKTEAAELTAASKAALQQLYAAAPLAKGIGPTAHAILVFPKVKKAGLGIGGQYGEGTLFKKGAAVAYYKTTGASIGLQAGGQQYGYAMFFMNEKALAELDNAKGFEVGVGPSIVVVDEGMAKTTTTNTLKDDIYAFVFGQKGVMAGLGLQGNKITKITPKLRRLASRRRQTPEPDGPRPIRPLLSRSGFRPACVPRPQNVKLCDPGTSVGHLLVSEGLHRLHSCGT